MMLGLLLQSVLVASAYAGDVQQPPLAYLWPVEGKVSIHGAVPFVLNNLRTRVPFLSDDLIDVSSWPVVHIETENVSGRFLIDEFLRQDPRYTAVIDGDFVVLMSSRAAADPDYPLSRVLDRVVIRDASLYEIASAVCVRAVETTGRELWVSGTPRQGSGRTLDVSSRTVRNVLMEAAAQTNDSISFQVQRDIMIETENGMRVRGDRFRYRENGFGSRLFDLLSSGRLPRADIKAILERRRHELRGWKRAAGETP